MANISCDKCHYVSVRKSKKSLFINENANKSCFQCHQGRRALMFRSAHMPVKEGKMICASCHNPHGGSGPTLLKKASINETCYMCHQGLRGPFLWEHAPVRENCVNCHEPHGSNHKFMLKRKAPYLCQSCHIGRLHSSELVDANNLVGGAGINQWLLLGKACLNCHSRIHGSNHPSGARFQR